MEQYNQQNSVSITAPLLTRAFMFLADGDWKSANAYCDRILDLEPQNAYAYLGKLMAELKVKNRKDLQNCKKPFDNNRHYQRILHFGNAPLRAEMTECIAHINAQKESMPPKFNSRPIIIAVTVVLFICICITFAIIVTTKILPQKYDEAIALKNEGRYNEAIAAFENLNGYKHSDNWIEVCKKSKKYDEAVALMESGQYAEAQAIFKALDNFGRSAENARGCELALQYNSAIALMDIGNYKEAITVFEMLDGYKDSDEKLEECNLEVQYNDATTLISTGKIVEAYEVLIALDGYKDSADKADSIYDQYKIERLKTAQIGDCVIFGTYNQDNILSNGKEPIEWLVLDIQDGKMLVISKYGLDCKPYDTNYSNHTWDTCTLRIWLNETFIHAFTADEQKMIPIVTVPAHQNPYYTTYQGNATQDQIFLLSIQEVSQYFGLESDRICKPANHADSASIYCCWWLRTRGDNRNAAVYVGYDGSINYSFTSVQVLIGGYIRPAMWIDLDALDKSE